MKTLRSLSDLSALLPEKEQQQKKEIPAPPARGHDGKGRTVSLHLDSSGRKGKTVTIVKGLQHNPDTMEELARTLKQYCGAGGTVKEGTIEVQGDHRVRLKEKLTQLNYRVR